MFIAFGLTGLVKYTNQCTPPQMHYLKTKMTCFDAVTEHVNKVICAKNFDKNMAIANEMYSKYTSEEVVEASSGLDAARRSSVALV